MVRRTKIDALPQDVRDSLTRLLADRQHGGYIVLSNWLKEQGFDISHAAVWRADQRVQRTMDAIRASTEAARMIASATPDQADEHTAAVIRLVQSSLFEAMLKVREAADADPVEQMKLLSQAAQAVAQVGRASIAQKRWQDEVRDKLDALERAQGAGGKRLDADTLKAVRESLYG